MNRYLLSLDAGTTSFKGALFTADRQLVATAQRDYTLCTPQEGIVEFPADSYWRLFCEITRELLKKVDAREGEVLSIAISSQGETLICLDEKGEPLGNAIVWLDNRAVGEADELRDRFGVEQVYNMTGQADMLATWPAAKILWLKKNRPAEFERTAKYLLLEDYLLFRLTGKFAGEPNLWASSAMLDIHTGQWWMEMLETLGISANQLPELRPCGSALCEIAPSAAAQTALPAGTLAVMGALDQTCNAVGCGLTRPGMVCETTGSCLAVTAVVDRFIPYHPEMQLTCQNYAVPGRYAILLWSQSAGMTLKWFAQKFYSEYERLGDAFDQINREAEGVDTGCNGLTMLPHLTGAANPEYDAYARGAFSGATLEHGRGHFARAIMEAVACMLRRNLEQLDAVGVKTDSVYCLGGGVNSRLWLQIKADLTGKTMIPLRSQESACLGAAILAGVGAGEYESVDWIPEGRENAERIAPEVDQQSAGEEAYRRYIALYDALKPFFARNACERGENLC